MGQGFSIGSHALEEAATQLVAAAQSSSCLLASAESLTGGMVGQMICSVPGASAVYRGGVISYATEVKAQVLGVSAALLAERGAVDPDVALAMAAGATRVCGADYGLATTGAAGPEPCDGKPVGRVYLAACGPRESCVVEKNYSGSRDEIRVLATYDALLLLAEIIRNKF